MKKLFILFGLFFYFQVGLAGDFVKRYSFESLDEGYENTFLRGHADKGELVLMIVDRDDKFAKPVPCGDFLLQEWIHNDRDQVKRKSYIAVMTALKESIPNAPESLVECLSKGVEVGENSPSTVAQNLSKALKACKSKQLYTNDLIEDSRIKIAVMIKKFSEYNNYRNEQLPKERYALRLQYDACMHQALGQGIPDGTDGVVYPNDIRLHEVHN